MMTNDEFETQCDQEDCKSEAEFTYDWPGQGVMQACKPHAEKAQVVMKALGFNLILTPWKASKQLLGKIIS